MTTIFNVPMASGELYKLEVSLFLGVGSPALCHIFEFSDGHWFFLDVDLLIKSLFPRDDLADWTWDDDIFDVVVTPLPGDVLWGRNDLCDPCLVRPTRFHVLYIIRKILKLLPRRAEHHYLWRRPSSSNAFRFPWRPGHVLTVFDLNN
jgi:hypothetical protein